MGVDVTFYCHGFAREAMQSDHRPDAILGAKKVLFQFQKGNYNKTLQQSENLL